MSDKVIEEQLIRLCDQENDALSFNMIDNGFHVYWDSKLNFWQCCMDAIDPLSALIIKVKPKPNTDWDDDEIISSLAEILDRRANWIRSFQFGWYGESNKSDSISGYVLGNKLRIMYIP